MLSHDLTTIIHSKLKQANVDESQILVYLKTPDNKLQMLREKAIESDDSKKNITLTCKSNGYCITADGLTNMLTTNPNYWVEIAHNNSQCPIYPTNIRVIHTDGTTILVISTHNYI